MATPDMSNLTADIEAGLRSAQRPGTARSSLAASSLNTAIRDAYAPAKLKERSRRSLF